MIVLELIVLFSVAILFLALGMAKGANAIMAIGGVVMLFTGALLYMDGLSYRNGAQLNVEENTITDTYASVPAWMSSGLAYLLFWSGFFMTLFGALTTKEIDMMEPV